MSIVNPNTPIYKVYQALAMAILDMASKGEAVPHSHLVWAGTFLTMVIDKTGNETIFGELMAEIIPEVDEL